MKFVGVLALLLIATPVFAAGHLNITSTNSAPLYINTNQSYLMLNLSMNATGGVGNGTVYINNINVTIGNSTPVIISAVEIWNSTNVVIGANRTNSSATNFTIVFPIMLVVNSAANTVLSIYINVSASAPVFNITSVNVSSTSFGVDAGSNVSINDIANSTISGQPQIQDIHAVASITPKFVDTSVIQQTLQYTLNMTGADKINKTDIIVPVGYTIVNWTNITIVSAGGTNTYGYSAAAVTVAWNATRLNVSYATFLSTNDNVTVRFIVDINSSAIDSKAVASVLHGSNISSAPMYVRDNSAINITTKQLIIVQNVTAIKNAAIINGSDYWEFNFTLNFTANVSGLIQFKMSNWTSAEGYTMNLTNATYLFNASYYATFRESGNSNNYMNITTNYTSTQSVDSTGVSLTVNTNNMYSILLRMIIPDRTQSSSRWYTNYWMLFRAIP
ncbi:MAG: hypothetical protein V1900_02385 [Candidatus Aenigmatarchaeota archaeon]